MRISNKNHNYQIFSLEQVQVIVGWDDIYLQIVKVKKLNIWFFHQMKLNIQEKQKQFNQGLIVSFHDGDNIANKFSGFCSFLKFHKFLRRKSNLLVLNIYWIITFNTLLFLFLGWIEIHQKNHPRKSGITYIKNIFFKSLKVVQECHYFILIIRTMKERKT